MSSLLSIVPRASTTATGVLSAICLMSGVLPQHPCAYAQDEVPTSEPADEWIDPTAGQADGEEPLPDAPVPTVPLADGKWQVSTMTAKAKLDGDFGFTKNPEKKKEVGGTLEEDMEKTLREGESLRRGRRQEEAQAETRWKVRVSSLNSVDNDTKLEFDVEATKTELANGDEAAAPSKALEEFNQLVKVGGSAAFTGLEALYTQETGTAPRDGFSISSVTVNQTVVTEVFSVTEAPEEVVAAPGSSVSKTSIIVPSVLGGVCLSGLCALLAVAMIKRRSQGEEQTVQPASSETEPYGNNEQKEALNPLGQGENDLPFSPAEKVQEVRGF